MKKKATPKSSPKRDGKNNTSRAAQRHRGLKRLKKGPADTFTLRHEENILMPAARIKELREEGYEIRTDRITLIDERGRSHRGIALYTLIRMPRKKGVA